MGELRYNDLSWALRRMIDTACVVTYVESNPTLSDMLDHVNKVIAVSEESGRRNVVSYLNELKVHLICKIY